MCCSGSVNNGWFTPWVQKAQLEGGVNDALGISDDGSEVVTNLIAKGVLDSLSKFSIAADLSSLESMQLSLVWVI
jgi:hypothetical protein